MFNPPSEVNVTSVGNSLAFIPEKELDLKVFEHNTQLFFCSYTTGRVARLFDGNFSFYTNNDSLIGRNFHLHNGYLYRVTYRFTVDTHYVELYRIDANNAPGNWILVGTAFSSTDLTLFGWNSFNAAFKYAFNGEFIYISAVSYNYGTGVGVTTIWKTNILDLSSESVFTKTRPANVADQEVLIAHDGQVYLGEVFGGYPFSADYGIYEWVEAEGTFDSNNITDASFMPGGPTVVHQFNRLNAAGKYLRLGYAINDALDLLHLLLFDTTTNQYKITGDFGAYNASTTGYGTFSEIVFYNDQYYLFNWDKVYAMDPNTCALTLLYTFPAEAGSTYFNLFYVTSSGQLVGLKTTATTSEPISFDGPLTWVTPYSPLPIPAAFVEIIYPVVPRDEDNVVAVPMGNGGYRRERKTENLVVRRESTLRFRVDRSYIGTFEADLHSRRGQLFRLPTPGYTPFGVNSSDNLVYCLPHKGAKPTDKFASTFDIDVNFLFVSVAP